MTLMRLLLAALALGAERPMELAVRPGPSRAAAPAALSAAAPALPDVAAPLPAALAEAAAGAQAPGQATIPERLEAARLSLGEVSEAAQRGGDADLRSSGQDLAETLAGETPRRAESATAVAAGAAERASPRLPKAEPNEPGRARRWTLPYLTLGIVGANVAAYQWEAREVLSRYGGDLDAFIRVHAFSAKALRAAAAALDWPELWWRTQTLFTSLFLHADPDHLGRNIMNILLFGAALELSTRRRALMAAIFLAGGLAPHLARIAGLADPITAWGASAGLFALMGAYTASLFKVPERPLDILKWVLGVIALNAAFMELALWLRPVDLEYDHFSHVLGFAVGALAGWRWLRGRAAAKNARIQP